MLRQSLETDIEMEAKILPDSAEAENSATGSPPTQNAELRKVRRLTNWRNGRDSNPFFEL
jgi:hypothetical protein